MSYRLIADKQTLLKIHLPDVKKITSNRLVLSGGNGQSCSDMSGPSVHSIELQWLEINESIIFGIESHILQPSTASCIHDSHFCSVIQTLVFFFLLEHRNERFMFCSSHLWVFWLPWQQKQYLNGELGNWVVVGFHVQKTY